MPGPPIPTLVSAVVASDGVTLTLTFDLSMTGSTGFTPKVGGVSRSFTIAGAGTTRVLTLSSVVYSGETVTLDYVPGDMQSGGQSLGGFIGFSVTNNSTQFASVPATPIITGVVTTSSGGILVERVSYT